MADLKKKTRKKNKQMDEMLDSLLANYSSAEPRPGLETRILANLGDADRAATGRAIMEFWVVVGGCGGCGGDHCCCRSAGGGHRNDKAPPVVVQTPQPAPSAASSRHKCSRIPPQIMPEIATHPLSASHTDRYGCRIQVWHWGSVRRISRRQRRYQSRKDSC